MSYSAADMNRLGEKIHALVQACRKVLDSDSPDSLVCAISEMDLLVNYIDYAKMMAQAAIEDTTYYKRDGVLREWILQELLLRGMKEPVPTVLLNLFLPVPNSTEEEDNERGHD